MEGRAEKLIYVKADKTFEKLKSAIAIFEEYLQKTDLSSFPLYYRARNNLKEAESSFKELMMNAKKLLGPLPPYAAQDYYKLREDMLEEDHILAKSVEFDQLLSEVIQDPHLKERMDEEEIRFFLKKNFQSQQEGKRKLANIKIRMILDKLKALLLKAQGLRERALKTQQKSL